ncbi:MAG: hypothetical protein K0R80_3487, partial [Clostridia bacterium]|nr:hypothetical protein [Clostridia bacterium]
MKKRLSLLAAALFILLAACSQTASIPSPEKVQILQPPPQPLKFEIASLGFNITVLDNMQMDDSYQPYYIRFSNHTLDLKISKEKSPYEDLDSYFNKYIYKYLLNETFHKAN